MPGKDQGGWGWTSYTQAGWALDGVNSYVGRFMRNDAPPNLGYERCRVVFHARRPILALRAIVNSGQDPITFAGQEIN